MNHPDPGGAIEGAYSGRSGPRPPPVRLANHAVNTCIESARSASTLAMTSTQCAPPVVNDGRRCPTG